MATAQVLDPVPPFEVRLPVNATSEHFSNHPFDYYAWLRRESPVHLGKISVLTCAFVSRYEDCMELLKDPRFVRNRSTATGGRRSPVPLPKSVQFLALSMIVEDDPEHRRKRSLVNKAFTPGAVAKLAPRIEAMTHELLDVAEAKGQVDLMEAYALPIPVRVISEMVGVSKDDMPGFKDTLKAVTRGFSGWAIFRTMFFDLPGAARFARELIARKRLDPQDDLLSRLIEAEEEGTRLTEDELVSMLFLLIVAGYETTLHLITNGVATLLQHPAELDRLRADPSLLDSAVEEILRFRGPIQATKPGYPTEDVTLHGVTIKKGTPTFPLLGSANRDPAVFEDPERFDIGRSPNHHLAFGHGPHFCLGAQLARMETRIALQTLIDRNPNLQLAVPSDELKMQRLPLWHRHQSLPVRLG